METESYQAQVEQNLAVLKQELPTLFERDLSYDIYTRDIFFRDPVNKFKGKFNYRIIFWTLRFHGGLFFSQIAFDLHDIKQIEENQIRADWTVRGKLRLPWNANIFFNGYSIYKMNQTGLIDEHIDTWDRSPKKILQQFLPGNTQDSIEQKQIDS